MDLFDKVMFTVVAVSLFLMILINIVQVNRLESDIKDQKLLNGAIMDKFSEQARLNKTIIGKLQWEKKNDKNNNLSKLRKARKTRD